ncbi:MAG: hypothetical protein Q4P18_06015 [Methanobrevibacter sp.]|uniref:hypothetical protein n=1 Tax=Methanobrevibacter sp. TaxID=66852 RepID=UPI0026E04AE8|nr:hypothetical protein [Methanobrevibacter sp.]MDO5849069.1 hypothetical protein [Methanobrevibacter sp.]
MKTKYLLLLLAILIAVFTVSTVSASEKDYAPFVENISDAMLSNHFSHEVVDYNPEEDCYILGFTNDKNNIVTYILLKGSAFEFINGSKIRHVNNTTVNGIDGYLFPDMNFTNFVYQANRDIFIKVCYEDGMKLDLKDYVIK